ncbi:MAG: branched-chain amino acid ABC transporter permease [Paracoccaceae bacterium]|nr:MAG: branched-chain amino acid ABC transporter permease [Alphaproteobacteria bacterium]GIX12301.1 MAG: branched-chain amino acid ABC transporter permease [Paracoccaceae bacterium]
MWEFVNFYLIPGLVLGCIYALGALGITLTFGILRFANFAHGEVMMLGTYLALTMVWLFGLHPLLAALPAMALTALLMLGLDRAFFRPFRSAPTIISVIASFGLMLMIRSAVQVIWGTQPRPILPGVQRPQAWLDGAILLAPKHVWILLATLAIMAAIHLLLTRTRIGKAMRAVADSPELARLTGIPVETVIRATWVVAAATAVAAGVMLAIDTQVETMMGFKMLLPMFAAAILGGIGRPFGAVAGGLVIGVAEELSAYPWLGTAPLLNPAYKSGIAFAIMVAMLVWRPSGLFRGRVL